MAATRTGGSCAPLGEGGVADSESYVGSGIGLVDDKGRVAIPASLRAALSTNSPKTDGKDGGTIVIAAHESDRCLVGYHPGHLAVLRERLDRRERENTIGNGAVDYSIKRRGAAAAEQTPFDGSGRFIMPAFPRFYARITKYAFFYGSIDYIDIWDPKALIDDERQPDIMRESAQFHLESKGIVL